MAEEKGNQGPGGVSVFELPPAKALTALAAPLCKSGFTSYYSSVSYLQPQAS